MRREVPVAVPKGSSSHKVTLGALDPASLFPLDSGVAISRVSRVLSRDDSVLRRLLEESTVPADKTEA